MYRSEASNVPSCKSFTVFTLFALSVTSLIMGIKYQDVCTIEPYIPTYMIVSGSFCSFFLILDQWLPLVLSNNRWLEGTTGLFIKVLIITKSIVLLFLCCWFLAGCTWVYRVFFSVNFNDPASPAYCHRTLYLYSFWLLSVTWMLILCVLVVVCICGLTLVGVGVAVGTLAGAAEHGAFPRRIVD